VEAVAIQFLVLTLQLAAVAVDHSRLIQIKMVEMVVAAAVLEPVEHLERRVAQIKMLTAAKVLDQMVVIHQVRELQNTAAVAVERAQ
jgi:hypothetical protein